MLIQAFLMGSLFGLLTITALAHAKWRVQIYGRTIDSDSGKPVYCTIELYDDNGEMIGVTESNSDGDYALFVPSQKKLQVKVSENGYCGKMLELQPIPAGRKERNLDIELNRWAA